MSHSENPKSTETFANMMNAFNFTAEDVDANRRGIITPRQRARLRSVGHGISGCSLQGLIGMTIFVVVVGAFLSYGFYSNESTRGDVFGNPANLAILLAALAIPIVVMAVAYFSSQRRAGQLSDAQVRVAEGNATIKQTISAHGGTTYVVRIGAKRFNFLEEYGGLFKQGASYRIYYAQAGPYEPILSIEELGE